MNPSAATWALLILATMLPIPGDAQSIVERASVNSEGVEGDLSSYRSGISADGRFVVFRSEATNLVPGDLNDWSDIFVHDRQTGQTIRVSVASDGTESDSYSRDPTISHDGRYVAFASRGENLVPGDSNNFVDIFVHDLSAGETQRVSVATDGTQANGDSWEPKISGNGRYVVFESDATNLAGASSDLVPNVFLHDLQNGVTELVTDDGLGPPYTGIQAAISADGRYVAFLHQEGDCPIPFGWSMYAYVRDRQFGSVRLVSVDSNGNPPPVCFKAERLSISPDGSRCGFTTFDSLAPDDTNGTGDFYVYGMDTGTSERVSVKPDGSQIDEGCHGGRQISDVGRPLTFGCYSPLLPPEDVGPGNSGAYAFIRDVEQGTLTLISLAYRNYPAGPGSGGAAVSISPDGVYVTFETDGSEIVPNDNNGETDVFVWDSSRLLTGDFESGTDCRWSDSLGGLGCPDGIAATGFITAYSRDNGHQLIDSAVFMLRDGVNPRTTFEIESAGNGVAPGNIAVDLTGAPSGPAFPAYALPIVRSAINAAPSLDITATTLNDSTLLLTNDQPGEAGNRRITGDFIEWLVFSYEGMSGGVDPRP